MKQRIGRGSGPMRCINRLAHCKTVFEDLNQHGFALIHSDELRILLSGPLPPEGSLSVCKLLLLIGMLETHRGCNLRTVHNGSGLKAAKSPAHCSPTHVRRRITEAGMARSRPFRVRILPTSNNPVASSQPGGSGNHGSSRSSVYESIVRYSSVWRGDSLVSY